MLAVFAWGCLSSEESVSALTVKYEFPSSSPNVVLTGSAACGANTYNAGNATITFSDNYLGGNPVTLQAGFNCNPGPSNITVNTFASGNFPSLGTGCCGASPNVQSATITSAYNNGVAAKTIVIAVSGTLIPLNGVVNSTNPMFRISVTLLPGISTPTSGGFTNSTLPTLSWPALTGATAYQLEVHTDPFFNSPYVSQLVPGTTQYTITVGQALTNAVSYYTRIKATNGSFAGIWSYIGDFTVATTAPAAPTTNTPANNANVPVQTPTFNWSAVTSGPE